MRIVFRISLGSRLAKIYLFKINNRNNIERFETFSKFTIRTPE